jgi:hypothetical protein
MSSRFLRCFVVTGLVISLGMVPWSSAQAAPARQSLSANLGPTVAQTLHKLFTVFRLLLQAQNGNPPNGNPPNGNPGGNPSGNSQDGVAIDPHGKPGPRGN